MFEWIKRLFGISELKCRVESLEQKTSKTQTLLMQLSQESSKHNSKLNELKKEICQTSFDLGAAKKDISTQEAGSLVLAENVTYTRNAIRKLNSEVDYLKSRLQLVRTQIAKNEREKKKGGIKPPIR